MSACYLLPEYDELKMRPGREYTKFKNEALKRYIYKFSTAMKSHWKSLNYVDLYAGPGKVSILKKGSDFTPKEYILGSPLLAITTRFPLTRCIFVEKAPCNFKALEQRVNAATDRRNTVDLMKLDCDEAIDDIVSRLVQLESALNLAYIDPEGLEIRWGTIRKLASVGRMDLIINYSTRGVIQNVKQMSMKEGETRMDRFFGTREWREVYKDTRGEYGDNHTMIGRKLLDYYKGRLGGLGYKFIFNDPELEEFAIKNSKNRQMYTLIGAGKHARAAEFWNKSFKGAFKKITGQQELPGFS